MRKLTEEGVRLLNDSEVWTPLRLRNLNGPAKPRLDRDGAILFGLLVGLGLLSAAAKAPIAAVVFLVIAFIERKILQRPPTWQEWSEELRERLIDAIQKEGKIQS